MLVLALLTASACGPATIDARTVATADTSTPRPVIRTPTSTPVPPLVAHVWTQSEPLIVYGMPQAGGLWSIVRNLDGMYFTLLPDGELFLSRRDEYYRAMGTVTTKLSRQATCELLNSIDQTGLFDSNYYKYQLGNPLGPEGAYPVISVKAWRSFPGRAPSPMEFMLWSTPSPDDCGGCTAIRNTIRLLDQYQPSAPVHALEIERLGVWFQTIGELKMSRPDIIAWPIKSPRLGTAASTMEQLPSGDARPVVTDAVNPAIILTGADARQVYNALGTAFQPVVVVQETGTLYYVYARPLLPNEFNAPLPRVSLSCSPSDGWHRAP